jgi:hypothetical protein
MSYFPTKEERQQQGLQPEWQPSSALQPITPVGDNSVIETLEKVIPYSEGEVKYVAEAQLAAYKNRK